MDSETPSEIKKIVLPVRNNKYLKDNMLSLNMFVKDQLSDEESSKVLNLIDRFQIEIIEIFTNGAIISSTDGEFLNISIQDLIDEGSLIRNYDSEIKYKDKIELNEFEPQVITINKAASKSKILSTLLEKYTDNRTRANGVIYIIDSSIIHKEIPANLISIFVKKFENFMNSNGYSIVTSRSHFIGRVVYDNAFENYLDEISQKREP